MTITGTELIYAVDQYLDRYPEESKIIISLRTAMESNKNIFSRSTFPLHVTCSAVVIDDTGSVLMVHHRALNKWLIPGGHIEPGDHSLVGASLRELHEETGVNPNQAISLDGWDGIPLDIDVHKIPTNPLKGEPEHWHADMRFVFRTLYPRIEIQAAEVTQYGWKSPKELTTERLIGKTVALANESISWK